MDDKEGRDVLEQGRATLIKGHRMVKGRRKKPRNVEPHGSLVDADGERKDIVRKGD